MLSRQMLQSSQLKHGDEIYVVNQKADKTHSKYYNETFHTPVILQKFTYIYGFTCHTFICLFLCNEIGINKSEIIDTWCDMFIQYSRIMCINYIHLCIYFSDVLFK